MQAGECLDQHSPARQARLMRRGGGKRVAPQSFFNPCPTRVVSRAKGPCPHVPENSHNNSGTGDASARDWV